MRYWLVAQLLSLRNNLSADRQCFKSSQKYHNFGLVALVALGILGSALLLTACEPDFNYDEGETIPDPPFSVNVEDSTFTDAAGESHRMGCVCDGGANYQLSAALLPPPATMPDNLPETFDLSPDLPPVGDQGEQLSCTSWAISYYLKSFQEGSAMSPAYTYNQLVQGNCGGTSQIETFALLQEKGVAPLNRFPYDPTDCSTQPDSAVDASAAPHRIRRFYNLDTSDLVNEIKYRLLDNTPVVLSVVLNDQFARRDTLGLTAYRPHDAVSRSPGLCHAMLLVGYNDAYRAFKVVNSWGTNFGDNGFVWIDYQAFANAGDPGKDFRVINQAMITTDL